MNWKWEIHYSAEVQGVFSEHPIEIEDKIKGIKLKVKFVNVEGFIRDKVLFECLDYKSNEKKLAEENTKGIVSDIINILSDQYKASFFNLFIVHLQKFDQGWMKRAYITLEKTQNIQLNEVQKVELLNLLKDKSYLQFLSNNPHQQLFRSIIFSENKVGNFIAMYSLLNDIIESSSPIQGRGQAKIDNFIRLQNHYWNSAQDRNSTKHTDRAGNPIKETKYTWLRNQIGHTQLNTDILKVEYDIEEAYPDLLELVRIAINLYVK
jgi:hypothetical protein